MATHSEQTLSSLFQQSDSLTAKLGRLHGLVLQRVPVIDRIACAVYDPKTDLLKTFFNSTHRGEAIEDYEYPLASSHSLSELREKRLSRVISHIEDDVSPDTEHSKWLLEQGYQSSFTVPLYSADSFLGFLFFDSQQADAFSEQVQRDLILHSTLVVMLLSSELTAVQSLLATAKAARDFAKLRDFETGSHLERMAQLARVIARQIKDQHKLSDENIEHIYRFAPLHDIGKIGIPDRVLLKPGPLSQEERELMNQHVRNGIEILHRVLDDYNLGYLADSQLMLDLVAHHHEFLDGSGYPQGLTGDQIPIVARIITTADIFDALTSRRSYKQAWSIDEALNEMDTMVDSGKLDPDCVKALRSRRTDVAKIVLQLSDESPNRDSE